jgi:hypothetical protein
LKINNFLILQKSWKFFSCEPKDEEITIPNASEDSVYINNMTEVTDAFDEEYVITDGIISFPSNNIRSEPSTEEGLEPIV